MSSKTEKTVSEIVEKHLTDYPTLTRSQHRTLIRKSNSQIFSNPSNLRKLDRILQEASKNYKQAEAKPVAIKSKEYKPSIADLIISKAQFAITGDIPLTLMVNVRNPSSKALTIEKITLKTNDTFLIETQTQVDIPPQNSRSIPFNVLATNINKILAHSGNFQVELTYTSGIMTSTFEVTALEEKDLPVTLTPE